ncbi:MAG: S8 family serine peptidase [Vicinamibacterales bacterium]
MHLERDRGGRHHLGSAGRSAAVQRRPVPHLLAPGMLDATAQPGGTYDSGVGTSFAAPHVAGAWAVLKQAQPTATPTAVLAALTSTGTPVTHWSSGLHPVINVDAADDSCWAWAVRRPARSRG